MTKINHQDNFASNLASNTTATDTTSTLNDTPSASAPFYLAFDATDTNGNYEVLRCITSPGSGVVTHAATANDHVVAEEVRMVCPGKELDLMYQVPEGTLLNGKIVPTDAAGLTLTLQTQAGADPSATDPVYVMIGGTLRSVTAATTAIATAGFNYFNSGSAELATKEVDYFVYAYWDSANSLVRIGFARISHATLIDDFNATDTNEKGFLCNTVETAGDDVVNIGRFAATLSAGAGYTWTVPTYTTKNLIQRPIYETRWLDYTPAYTWTAGADPSSPTAGAAYYKYKILDNTLKIQISNVWGSSGTTVTLLVLSRPFSTISSGSQIQGLNGRFAQGTAPLLSYGYSDGSNFVVGSSSSTIDRIFLSGSMVI